MRFRGGGSPSVRTWSYPQDRDPRITICPYSHHRSFPTLTLHHPHSPPPLNFSAGRPQVTDIHALTSLTRQVRSNFPQLHPPPGHISCLSYCTVLCGTRSPVMSITYSSSGTLLFPLAEDAPGPQNLESEDRKQFPIRTQEPWGGRAPSSTVWSKPSFPPAEEAAAHSGHSGHSSKGHVVDVLIFEGTYICDAPRTSSF